MLLSKDHLIEGEIFKKGSEIKILESSYDYDRKFDEFNDLYFDGKLSPVRFSEVNKPRASHVALADNRTSTMEINLAHWNGMNERQKDSTFVHEMIHFWTFDTGQFNSKNIHQGAFHKKAKEIEAINPKLTLTGRMTTSHEDDFEGLEQKDCYIVFYLDRTYLDPNISLHDPIIDNFDQYKLLGKTVTGAKLFPITDSIEDIKKTNISFMDVGFLYRITLNTPIGEYDRFSKLFDWKENEYIIPKGSKAFLSKVKKNKEYAEFIEKFIVDSEYNRKAGKI